jgi:hypothetical protein
VPGQVYHITYNKVDTRNGAPSTTPMEADVTAPSASWYYPSESGELMDFPTDWEPGTCLPANGSRSYVYQDFKIQ